MSTLPVLTTIRSSRAEAAIIFVHGFGGNPETTWGKFPCLLAEDSRLPGWDLFSVGYSTRLVPDIVGIWSANAPLDRLANLLHVTASVPPLVGYKSISIVAHSMGGLITQRALLDYSELALRVSHVFLFGTPSAGLAKAGPFAFLKRQARDMGEKSAFILDLRERWKDTFASSAPFKFWTIAGDQDEFVPSDSSLNPFPFADRVVVAGNHISIVKPQSPDDLGFKVVSSGIIGEATVAGPRNAARVAAESRDFVTAIQLFGPHQNELDTPALVALALAFEETGRQEDAIKLLEKNIGTNTDPMGVLAGRLKRRWLVEHRRADAIRALELYRQAYALSIQKNDAQQAFYHGINVAFMELAFGSDINAAKDMARKVLAHCGAAQDDFWRLSTEADAHLILGNSEIALTLYRGAVGRKPEPRQLKSMCQQALRLADLLKDEEAEKHLTSACQGEELSAA